MVGGSSPPAENGGGAHYVLLSLRFYHYTLTRVPCLGLALAMVWREEISPSLWNQGHDAIDRPEPERLLLMMNHLNSHHRKYWVCGSISYSSHVYKGNKSLHSCRFSRAIKAQVVLIRVSCVICALLNRKVTKLEQWIWSLLD